MAQLYRDKIGILSHSARQIHIHTMKSMLSLPSQARANNRPLTDIINVMALYFIPGAVGRTYRGAASDRREAQQPLHLADVQVRVSVCVCVCVCLRNHAVVRAYSMLDCVH